MSYQFSQIMDVTVFKNIIFFPLETHHRLYQASCPSGDETTIPQESDHNQHQHRQHISQPNKFLGQDTSILQGIQ